MLQMYFAVTLPCSWLEEDAPPAPISWWKFWGCPVGVSRKSNSEKRVRSSPPRSSATSP